jgi:YD repeat-containing protein
MGKIIRIFIFVFAALILLFSPASLAQVQSYYYQGPAFNYFDCAGDYTCENGNVNASATIIGMPANYSGHIPSNWINSIYISSLGFTLGPSDPSSTSGQDFYFNDGKMVSWSIGLIRYSTPILQANASSADGTSASDLGWIQYNSPFHVYYGVASSVPAGFWTSSKVLGIACARPGACAAGEPIDLGSGNMFSQITDYSTEGQNLLAFTRTYNSMAMPDTYAASMGRNWRHNYDRYLHILNPSAIYGVTVERPDGQVISFSSNSGTYTPDSDVDMRLTNPSGSTWMLIDGNDTVETYTASGDKGTLNSIRLRNGYTQAISYSSGQISYVSDSYSRQLGFTYSSAGLLTSITTPDAQTISYSYVNFSSTNQNLLTAVSY